MNRRLMILALTVVPAVALASAAGTFRDTTSNLTWQDPPAKSAADDTMSWSEAQAYCDALSLGGLDDWRLPTIGELRSLIRNSPLTEAGGSCGVKAGCLGHACRDSKCDGSDASGSTCNWPGGVSGPCTGYWSGSSNADASDKAWLVLFYDGSVHDGEKSNYNYVRCVSASAAP